MGLSDSSTGKAPRHGDAQRKRTSEHPGQGIQRTMDKEVLGASRCRRMPAFNASSPDTGRKAELLCSSLRLRISAVKSPFCIAERSQ